LDRTARHIECADWCRKLAPVDAFVSLSGHNQVAFPDYLMNCRSEIAV
jgi:hypothetical protein